MGGDQLTRIRLKEAKALRGLSPDWKRRFEDLDHIVVELWHVKQDLLEVWENFFLVFLKPNATS